jgi:hypothetical protein
MKKKLKITKKRAAEATRLSARSISRVMKETETVQFGTSSSFADSHKDRIISPLIPKPVNFNECPIRRTRNEKIDKQRNCEKVAQPVEFAASQSPLRKVLMGRLHVMGTKTKRTGILVER